MLSKMSRQLATSTINICEPAHIIVNQTSAAGDSHIHCANSKSEYAIEKGTLTTNVCDANHILTTADNSASKSSKSDEIGLLLISVR